MIDPEYTYEAIQYLEDDEPLNAMETKQTALEAELRAQAYLAEAHTLQRRLESEKAGRESLWRQFVSRGEDLEAARRDCRDLEILLGLALALIAVMAAWMAIC